MGVEIVLHQNDFLGIREVTVGQILKRLGIIHSGAPIGDFDAPPPFERIGGAQTSTTRNPYLYLGGATQYRFASFKRSTWSGERSNQMSADTGMSYQSRPTRQHDGSHGRGCWHGEPWKPVEILAMVLGFFVFWPIGFAVLAWKFWQKKSGYPGDIISFGREKWGNWANWARGSDRWGFAVNNWAASGSGMGSTGNRAFDQWRATELARLEEERQKLVAAVREFAEFMENLRHARDREEFERFMNEHRNRKGHPSGRGFAGDVKRLMRRDLAELKEMVRLGAGIPGDEQRIEMIKGLLAR
jgi:hypothetical protein